MLVKRGLTPSHRNVVAAVFVACGGGASPDVPYPEGSLNQQVKKLIQKLGEAIHESVSESENIAGVVKNIREQGFDVLLMLEATIGLNELEMDEAESAAPGEETEEVEGPFTSSDLNFLKSLRISISDEDQEHVAAEDEPSE